MDIPITSKEPPTDPTIIPTKVPVDNLSSEPGGSVGAGVGDFVGGMNIPTNSLVFGNLLKISKIFTCVSYNATSHKEQNSVISNYHVGMNSFVAFKTGRVTGTIKSNVFRITR